MIDHQPLISVIIPVYNRERLVSECIDSVLNQTYQNTEIIIVNDGSTDNSLKIMQDYQSRYSNIKVISQENHGVSSARNAGINIARGEYITFLDSDDILYPNAIEILLKTHNHLNNHQVIVVGDVHVEDRFGKVSYLKHENCNEMSPRDFHFKILTGGFTMTFGLQHVSIFNIEKFNENIRIYEDHELILRLCLLHGIKIYLIHKPIGKVRLHDGPSITRSLKYNEIRRVEKERIHHRDQILEKMDPQERDYHREQLKHMRTIPSFRNVFRHFYYEKMVQLIGRDRTIKILNTYAKIKSILKNH